jgi:hypothetical protein
MSDEGVKLKAGIAGASAEISLSHMVVAALIPGRIAKARVSAAITDQVVERIRSGTYTDTDADYVKVLLGDAEAKLLRQQQVATRTVELLAEMPTVPPLPPMSNAEKGTEARKQRLTAEDWLSRFWDDAGLVSDEDLQEIYAHILATEARAPGSCSLRTLRVLRYMDRQTADAFAKLLPLVMNSQWVPSWSGDDNPFGQDVDFDLVLELADAGLIESQEVSWGPSAGEKELFLQYGTLVLKVRDWINRPGARVPVYTLTRAGTELARVADVSRTQAVFFALGRWLCLMAGLEEAQATWAEMAADGDVKKVADWKLIPGGSKPEEAKPDAVAPADGDH